MENNGTFRPRASTLPSKFVNKSRRSSGESRRSSDSTSGVKAKLKISMDKLSLEDLPNGYSTEGPRRKPKPTRLAVLSQEGGPRRRATAINAPSPGALLRPPSTEPKTRRKSAPVYNLNSPGSRRNSGNKAPVIRVDSPVVNGSPRAAWSDIDKDLRGGIEREPLPDGSPEFMKCMLEEEEKDLDINQNKTKPKPKRQMRLSTELHPKTIQKNKSPSSSPKTPRRVTWK